jgi:hypothetical protein
MSEQRKGEVTALGGRLVWWGRNKWAWSDGTPAPEVRDITPSWHYNFRVRGDRGPGAVVEVPVKTAQAEPELGWVLRGDYPRDLSGDHGSTRTIHMDGRETRTSDSGKAIPEVILVPADEWDEWDASTSIGAKWDKADEAAIFAKARSLGWEAPQ